MKYEKPNLDILELVGNVITLSRDYVEGETELEDGKVVTPPGAF